jgi:hypothetical protein
VRRRAAGGAVLAGLAVLALAACGDGGKAAASSTASRSPSSATTPATTPPVSPTTSPTTVPPTPAATTPAGTGGATLAPAWLGTRVLPTDARGYGVAGGTPPELRDRRIVTVDLLPPPADGRFHSTVTPVPPAVVERSTWAPGCPVALADLRYLTVSFRGFDGRAHTGELIVHRSVAADVVTVFRRLFAAGFPIERMHVTTVEERDAAPTGDGNNTGAFTCRSAVSTSSWSEHAYGRAIDVDPFQNPYLKGSLVLPELAGSYTDRRSLRPGMITAGGPVVAAFRSVGWRWGGNWRTAKDYMHFSVNGR